MAACARASPFYRQLTASNMRGSSSALRLIPSDCSRPQNKFMAKARSLRLPDAFICSSCMPRASSQIKAAGGMMREKPRLSEVLPVGASDSRLQGSDRIFGPIMYV